MYKGARRMHIVKKEAAPKTYIELSPWRLMVVRLCMDMYTVASILRSSAGDLEASWIIDLLQLCISKPVGEG